MSERVASGLRAWTIQRLSAIYMLVFIVYAGFNLLTVENAGFEAWQSWISHPLNNIAVGLFMLSLLFHAWVGARDIILDYVKPFAFRMVKLTSLALYLIAMGIWAFNILVFEMVY